MLPPKRASDDTPAWLLPTGEDNLRDRLAELVITTERARDAAKGAPVEALADAQHRSAVALRLLVTTLLPRDLRQCKHCCAFWPADNIRDQEIGGDYWDDLCPECTANLVAEYAVPDTTLAYDEGTTL